MSINEFEIGANCCSTQESFFFFFFGKLREIPTVFFKCHLPFLLSFTSVSLLPYSAPPPAPPHPVLLLLLLLGFRFSSSSPFFFFFFFFLVCSSRKVILSVRLSFIHSLVSGSVGSLKIFGQANGRWRMDHHKLHHSETGGEKEREFPELLGPLAGGCILGTHCYFFSDLRPAATC